MDHLPEEIDRMPRLGRDVLYRTDGRNGLVYDLPAVITVTLASHPGDYPCPRCGSSSDYKGPCALSTEESPFPCDHPHNPLPVPESIRHVHLTVLSPGGFGSEPTIESETDSFGDEMFVGAKTFIPGSGTYVEWNVPHAYAVGPDAKRGPDGIAMRSWR